MDAQSPPPALGEDIEIAARLRRLDGAESVFLAGHGKVLRIIAGDLQKDPGIGAALVSLSRRMQEAWAETEAGRDALRIADRAAGGLQRHGMRFVVLDIGEQREVIPAPEPPEMGLQIAFERGAGAEIGELLGVHRIGEELDAARYEDRLLFRQRAGLFISRRQLACLDLAGLDIGLIEGVDADDRAGDRGGDLPAKELLAELVTVFEGDAHDGLAGALQRIDGAILCHVRTVIETDIGEEAVAAVDGGRAKRLGIDPDQPLTLLTPRLGDELLEARRVVGDARRSYRRDLVSAHP